MFKYLNHFNLNKNQVFISNTKIRRYWNYIMVVKKKCKNCLWITSNSFAFSHVKWLEHEFPAITSFKFNVIPHVITITNVCQQIFMRSFFLATTTCGGTDELNAKRFSKDPRSGWCKEYKIKFSIIILSIPSYSDSLRTPVRWFLFTSLIIIQ